MHCWRIVLLAILPLLVAVGATADELLIEPVHFSKLEPFLPERLDGFVPAPAEGSSSSAMGFKLTEASRRYHQGSEDSANTALLRITDGTGNQFFVAAHKPIAPYSRQTPTGYERAFTLDGAPAVEAYSTEDRSGRLAVFVSERFLIEIEIHGLNNTMLLALWKTINVKKLAKLTPN